MLFFLLLDSNRFFIYMLIFPTSQSKRASGYITNQNSCDVTAVFPTQLLTNVSGFLKPENLTAMYCLFGSVNFAKENFKQDLQVYEYWSW